MGALDSGYYMREVCKAYSILRTSLKDHYNGKVTCRKKKPQSILTKEEEDKLVEYIVEMGRLAHPLSANDLQLKVAEICQMRATPFKDGIPRRNWLKLFQKRHPNLVLRTPQSLEANRARNLSPSMVNTFYANLQHLYNQENYQPSHIWNVNESVANAMEWVGFLHQKVLEMCIVSFQMRKNGFLSSLLLMHKKKLFQISIFSRGLV